MLEFISAKERPRVIESGILSKDVPQANRDDVPWWVRTSRERNKPRWSPVLKIPPVMWGLDGQVEDIYFSAALHFLSAVSITRPFIKANIIIEPPTPKRNHTALLDAWAYVYRYALEGVRTGRWLDRSILGMALVDRFVRPSTYAIDRTSDIPVADQRHSYVATGKHQRITLEHTNTTLLVLDTIELLTVGANCTVYIEGPGAQITVPQGTSGKLTIIAPNGARFFGIVTDNRGRRYRCERTITPDAESAIAEIRF
jgi:hypothetical protein